MRDRPPIVTRPARLAPPHVRRFGSKVVEELASKTRYVDPALAANWAVIVGPELAALCRPGRLSAGRTLRTLELVARNGAAASRVAFEAETIRKRVNGALGPDTVGRVTVRHAAKPDAEQSTLDGVLGRFRASVRRRDGGEET